MSATTANRRRLVLRQGHGPWSAGTLLTRRGAQPDGLVIVSPWGRPDVIVELEPGEVVERRARGGPVRPRPPQPGRRTRPIVYATRNAEEAAARLLGPDVKLENLVEQALRSGGLSGDPDQGRPVTVPVEGVAAVLVRTRSPSGRKAFRIIGLRKEGAA